MKKTTVSSLGITSVIMGATVITTAPAKKETGLEKIETDTNEIARMATSRNEKTLFAALVAMENLPTENYVSLTGEYLEMKENATYFVVATGFTDIKSTDGEKMVKCVSFMMREGKEVKPFISGMAVLVSTVEKLASRLPDPNNFQLGLRIQTGEKVKSGSADANGGKYLSMQIGVLYASQPEPNTTSINE